MFEGCGALYTKQGFCAALGHDGFGDQFTHKENSQRYEDGIIKIAYYGNEIGDEVNRANRINDDSYGKEFCVPGCLAVAVGQV